MYIDDLLCLSTLSLDDHLKKLHQVFERLSKAGLKVNASKSQLCATSCEYLGCVLSQEEIRPQHKKVEAILAIRLPINIKTLRSFLGKVQYYHGIWEKRTDVLAHLTDLVGECGVSKSTKKAGSKKAFWHWDKVHQASFDYIQNTINRDVCLAYPNFNTS